MTVDDDLIERLEAEAKVSNAEPEELTVAVESDIEETAQEVEELRESVEEKDAEVEELQALVESKESEVEELQEEISHVKDFYAEELADESPVETAEDYKDRYSVEELRERHETLQENSEPAPNSADSGPNVQGPDDPEEEEVEEELSERRQVAAQAFRERARQTDNPVWDEIAEMTENGE